MNASELHDPSGYAERTDVVMARLHDTLAPSTVDEQVLVDWFRDALDLAHLQRLAAMVERARRASWPT
ncbi:MAG: hypothetical protein ACRD0W_00130 [Acidimicrobiales bacterium]